MARIIFAVSGLTTFTLSRVADGVKCPLASLVPATTVGETRIPLLAIVAKTLVACIAVNEYPCPNATVGAVVPDQSFSEGNKPADSPGNPEPVLLPIPNDRR
ncbi:unannotated protein [freshwater metagenome]|uniref:Unannotated protein n=1 Tax=freshwater metagenome TaxID=449393 RepID=A0A6J7QSA9_9ZZZZ